MEGRRYQQEEPKLNKKKVFGVIIGILVIIMFILTLNKLLQDSDKLAQKGHKETEKYFAVYTNEKWGVINQKGNFVLEPTYDEMIIVPDESQSVFLVTYDVNYETGAYKAKIIDEKGKDKYTNYEDVELIINYNNANVLWYENNAIKVKQNGKYGLIDLKGNELLECEYDSIESLKGIKNSYLVSKDGKLGLVDNYGNIMVQVKYDDILKLSEDNRKEFIIKNSDSKYGIANSDGTVELECKYDEIKNISRNGYYVVKENDNLEIINSDKSINISGNFDDVIEIAGDNFIIKQNDKYGIINSKNEEIIAKEYDDIKYAFGENFIVKQNDKYGVINLEKEVKIEIDQNNLIYRNDAEVFVSTENNEDMSPKIYNQNFEQRINGIISKVDVEKGYIKIYTDGEYKFYNFKLEEKKNTEIFKNNTIFLSKKNGKYGYINKKGEVVVNYIYDDATEQNEYGYASVKKDGKWGAVDKKGELVTENKYNLDNNVKIEFIGKWHLAEDLNANYYTNR